MKTMIFCLCLLAMGVWPADSQAQERENPWAISLTAGYGYDFQQLSRRYNNPFPLQILAANGVSKVQLGDPFSLQLGLTVPLGKQWGIETGLGVTSRSISYFGLFQNQSDESCGYCRSEISVRMFRVPLVLDLIPFYSAERNWRLHLKAGVFIDWSGVTDDFILDGPSTRETPSKVEVFDVSENESFMFLIFDEEPSPGFLAGMEWEKSFGKVGRLGWGLTFSRQFTSSTSLLIWGYDKKADNRVGGYYPNGLAFTSLMFHARYAFAL